MLTPSINPIINQMLHAGRRVADCVSLVVSAAERPVGLQWWWKE